MIDNELNESSLARTASGTAPHACTPRDPYRAPKLLRVNLAETEGITGGNADGPASGSVFN